MYLYFKRALDVIISVIMFIVLLPILLIVAILIKIESKGPVIFKQKRIGLNGRTFDIYKLRSMCVGAEKWVRDNIALRAIRVLQELEK